MQVSNESTPREVTPPVQLFGAQRDEDGNRTPVKFFGPKVAPATKPAKRPVRSTGKKAKGPGTKTDPDASVSTAADSSEKATLRPAPQPTQIPESDSSK